MGANTSARLANNRRIEDMLGQREILRDLRHPVSPTTADELAEVRHYTGYGGIDNAGTIGTVQMTEYHMPPGLCAKMWALVHHYHMAPIKCVLMNATPADRDQVREAAFRNRTNQGVSPDAAPVVLKQEYDFTTLD